MGQSIGSIGGGKKKQTGADDQQRNQPELEPGQKMADKGRHPGGSQIKPEGGADHGPRSVR